MRSVIVFSCEREQLLATLDEAPGATGLLIVSGGNEVRAGAHRGMTLLAQRLAARGVPVFRYDRRGVGDSSGPNGDWESGLPDMVAAVATFRREQPQLTRVVGFGNCDGAAALTLFGREAGVHALVLANPWLGDDPLPPPAAVRGHYLRRLLQPATWARLLRGGIDLVAFGRGLRRSVSAPSPPPLAARIAGGIATIPSTVVLASRDRTAQQFAVGCRHAAPVVTIDTASHSFAGDAADALERAILAALTT